MSTKWGSFRLRPYIGQSFPETTQSESRLDCVAWKYDNLGRQLFAVQGKRRSWAGGIMAANEPLIPSWCESCDGNDEDAIASRDVVLLNLAAAQGLPGTDDIDVEEYLDKLDDWADRVRIETLRHMYRFDPQSQQPPSEYSYGNSLGRFCCYFLLQVLQEDCGVVYNPDRKFDPDFHDPADVFVHGILDENGGGGTCATMPVIYVAVGRRLGYPVYLVETREHLFFRWDDSHGTHVEWASPKREFWIPPDRFNVEGSGEGIAYRDDAHYIQWPHMWKEPDFSHGRYLRSLTPTEEFASFVALRGECFWELGQLDEALKAYYYARKLVPEDQRYDWLHAKRTKEHDRRRERELESIREINERNRLAQAALQERSDTSAPTVVKIPFGTPLPHGLPPGVVVHYVPPEQADPLPPAAPVPSGRPIKIAAGRPIPSHLPPGTPIQVVPPHLADPLPPDNVHQPLSPPTSQTQSVLPDPHLEQLNRIQENNRKALGENNTNRTLRPS